MRVVLLLLWAATVMALDLRPYAGPEATLLRDRNEGHRLVVRELLVSSYREHGRRNPDWDADVEELLDAAAASLCLRLDEAARTQALARVTALVEPPRSCDDPLILWAGFELSEGSGWRIRNRWCNRANKAWEALRGTGTVATQVPALVQTQTLLHMLDTWTRNSNPTKAAEIFARYIPLASAAWAETWRRGELREAPERLLELMYSFDVDHLGLAEALLAAQREASAAGGWPVWVTEGAEAGLLVDTAWAARGSGWAREVTPEGWTRFRADLEEAARRSERSWADHPSSAVAGRAISITGGLGDDEARTRWFLRSTSRCFDRPATFDTYQQFLAPRWGGSFGGLMTYGQACLATGRFDTQVPWEAVEVVATALRDAKDPEGMERLRDAVRDADYGRTLDACLAGYLARDPGQAGAHAALRTAIAYRLGRLEEAGTWLAKTAPADLTSSLASTWGVTWDPLQEEVRQAVSREPSRF